MKEMTLKRLYTIISLLLFSLTVTYIDAFVHPPYFSKIPIKILFFLALPLLFFAIFKSERKGLRILFSFERNGIITALSLGIGIYGIILVGFLLTRGFIDYSNVTNSLRDGMGITADNFILVAVYISIMNSFLEEFFFRGFGFITVKKLTNRAFAYVFSPILFAVYHVGMMFGMFHPAVLILLLIGLTIGGMIFNWLNEKFECLYPSWFAHMFANFAINTVGCLLL